MATVLAAGLWLFWGTLEMPFHLDDYLHVAEVQGHDILPDIGPLSLFTFAQPVPDRMGPVQGDLLPWWSADDLLIDFFRPLSSLTYHIDHALFGSSEVAFHATNLVWWGALLCAVAYFYVELGRHAKRSLLTALVAGLVFALDGAHEGNVTWIAGRYTLVSVFFCVPALLAYHRWRQAEPERKPRLLVWTLVWLALALASSETPIGLAGFYLAYELSLAKGSVRERVVALLPVTGVLVSYVVLYVADGHGVRSSMWYLDPIRSPMEFIEVGLQTRFPKMLRSLLLPELLTPDLVMAYLRSEDVEGYRAIGQQLSLWLAVLVLVVFAIHAIGDRTSRFLLIGAIISLVPQTAALTPPRVLLLPTISISWVYATLLADALRRLGHLVRPLRAPWALVRLVVAVGLVGVHFWADPTLARNSMHGRKSAAEAYLRRAREVEMPTGEAAERARVLLLTSPTGEESCYMPIIRLEQGLGWPGGVWAVSACPGVHRFTRTGERTFRFTLGPPGFLGQVWAGLFRGDMDIPAGTRFKRGAMTVTAAEVDGNGAILALDVEIDLPLDHEDVWLVAWDGTSWARRRAPAIGEMFQIVAVPGPKR